LGSNHKLIDCHRGITGYNPTRVVFQWHLSDGLGSLLCYKVHQVLDSH
jgi:hypothetical protein